MTDSPKNSPTILIVDDNLNNVQVLGTILMDAKYRVAVAHEGQLVFDMLPKVQPDLILLDVLMPGMDGFEVCKRIKAIPAFRDTPIIFLTVKNDTEDIVKGFDLGAADFVTKPFRAKELLARIQTHITLMRLQQDLKKRNSELEEALANVRTLSGLIPICSYCKKIRNTDGAWEKLESYIREHTNSDFSHGICPDCSKAHFPQYNKRP